MKTKRELAKEFVPSERENAKIIRGPEGRVLWQSSYSPYNIQLGVALSATIKLIRTGEWRDACWFAHQIFISGPEAEEWLWLHLRTHSVEDIGPANPNAINVIAELEQTYFRCGRGSDRRYLIGFWGVRFLATQYKNRSNDEAFTSMVIKLREASSKPPEIPDRSYDYHMKDCDDRGMVHFLKEAARLGTDSGYDKTDFQWLLERAISRES